MCLVGFDFIAAGRALTAIGGLFAVRRRKVLSSTDLARVRVLPWLELAVEDFVELEGAGVASADF